MKRTIRHTLLNRWKIHATVLSGVLALLSVAYLIGLSIFIADIPRSPPSPVPQVDGIVVLTGGPERIQQSVSLLTAGSGTRLLISGVDQGVSLDDIRSLERVDSPLFDCCIDIGRIAKDTIGNATETAAWAHQNGYGSLLVVTSAYHLPRATQELRYTMPTLTLQGFPVHQASVHLDQWYLYPGSARLLIAEYTKYLLTLVRLRWLEKPTPAQTTN